MRRRRHRPSSEAISLEFAPSPQNPQWEHSPGQCTRSQERCRSSQPKPQHQRKLVCKNWSSRGSEGGCRPGAWIKKRLKSLTGATQVLAAPCLKKERKHIICLMDELDFLITKDEEVIYNFFTWSLRAGNGILLLGVSNIMDLPERLSNR